MTEFKGKQTHKKEIIFKNNKIKVEIKFRVVITPHQTLK